jgi:hypothetical protein
MASSSKLSRTVRLPDKDWKVLREALEAHNRLTGKWPKLRIDSATKALELRLGHRERAVLWVLGRL